MPIIQPGETRRRFLEYLKDTQDEVIGVGAVAGDTSTSLEAYGIYTYNKLYQWSGKRVKLHALGYAKTPECYRLPIRYGDSSSYTMGGKFGSFSYYDPLKQEIGAIKREKFADVNNPHVRKILGLLRKCKVTIRDMQNPSYFKKAYSISGLFSTLAYMHFHRAATLKKFSYFFAVVNLNWSLPILSVLYTYDLNTGHFDYPESRKYQQYLMKLWSEDKQKFIYNAQEIVKAKTDYTDLSTLY
jgi:hypothetical protein